MVEDMAGKDKNMERCHLLLRDRLLAEGGREERKNGRKTL
jgi:hypothetical protein